MDSDDSEDDDVLPQEECWTLPDDGWTLVERPQVKSRGVRFKTNVSNDARDGGIFEERNYYDALEIFLDDSAMLKYKRKEGRNTNVRVEAAYKRREDTVDVPLPMYVQPDRLPVSTRDDVTPIVSNDPDRLIGLPTVDTDGLNRGKEYRKETLYNSVNASVTIKEREVESWPRSSVMGQCVMKEEVNSEDSPAKQVRITETSKPMVSTQLLELSQECWTQGFLKLAEEAKLVVANSATFGIMKEDVQRSPEVTMPVAQTDLRNLPCQRMAGAFTRLAEEALLVDVGWTTSEDMEEIGPQRCGFGEVISKDISWRREDIVDRSVDFGFNEAKGMPTSVVEEDRSLQWSIDHCKWESHVELIGRPEMECEPGTSRGVFQVRKEVIDDKQEETAEEPDSNYAKLGNLTDRLRELVKQPRPAGSRPVDIGQLLRQLLPIEDEANEVGQPMSGAESADNCMTGNAV